MSLKIGNPFKYFGRMRNEYNQIKEFMYEHEQYLKPGNYNVLNLGKTIVYTNTDAAKEFLKKQAEESSGLLAQIKLTAKRILANFLRIRISKDIEANEGSAGELVLFTVGGEMKIFDFANELVLHFFNNPDEYKRMKLIYETFQPFFEIPVQGYLDDVLVIKESYIVSDASRGWSESTKELILEDYCQRFTAYLENCLRQGNYHKLSTEDLLTIFPQSILNTSLGQKVQSLLAKSEIKEWLIVECHGDLWSRNVLIDDLIYTIDWEFSSSQLFFYDFYHYMCTDLLCQNDSSLLHNYFSGKYEDLVKSLCEATGFSYSDDEKLLYFGLSIMQKLVAFDYAVGTEGASRWLELADQVFEQYGK